MTHQAKEETITTARATLSRRAFLIMAVALSIQSAHAGLGQLLERVTGSGEAGRLAVVLVDVTGSIDSADWVLYERSMQALLATNRPGDRVVLGAVGDQPMSKFIATADRGIVNKHKRLEDEAALKRANTVLGEDFAQLRGQATKPSKATYLLDSIAATGQLFAQGRAKQQGLTLLILSDMVEESPAANFARQPLDENTGRKLIEARRAQGLLPDLAGVRVYVVGASGRSAEQMSRVQGFWRAFFAASGATVQDYGRNPAELVR